MELSTNFQELPENLKKIISSETPRDLKLKAAKGVLPFSLNEQLLVLSFLSLENDSEIKETAKKTIKDLPYDSIKNALKGDLHPVVLDVLSSVFVKDATILELIAMNKNTSTDTLLKLIKIGTPSVLEAIAINQTRLIKEQRLLDALLEAPTLSASTLSRLQEFFLRTLSKVFIKPEEARVEKRLTEEVTQDLVPEVERVEELPKLDTTPHTERTGIDEVPSIDGPRRLDSLDIPQDIPPTFFEIPKELVLEKEEEEKPEERETILKKLSKMNVSDKIKLALFGNKEVRSTLIRDANKIVATTVLKSPKITDGEIAMYANSRNVCDEVIRIISTNKEWVKNYRVKVAIVNNPKTPISIAMKLVSSLNTKDLKDLAGSKNVSSAVVNLAKSLLNQRKTG